MVKGNTIYEQFISEWQRSKGDLAMRFEKKTWTYDGLKRLINETAGKLRELGIRKGEAVAVSLPNCSEAVALFYAISEIGAISYFIHPLTPPAQMATFMRKSGAKALFSIATSANAYKEELGKSAEVVAISPFRGTNLIKSLALKKMAGKLRKDVIIYHKIHGRPVTESEPGKGSDDAVYLNTGGTNGEPKIIELTNDAINCLAMKGYPLIGGDVKAIHILTAIPMFHGFGLCMGVHTPLSNGASTALMLKFRTKEAIKLIKDGDATVIIGVPTLYNALLSRDSFYGPWLKKQIIAFVGGDSVPPSLLERWNETMVKYQSDARLYEGYGLTEAVNVANVNTKAAHKFGSVGKPLPGLSEIIVDVDTRKVLPPNEPGELLIAGDSIMKGYLNDPKLTAETFVEIEGKRYIQTKDYGYIDEDGYFTYKQRIRRIVKVKGEGLCPSDLEKVALSFYEIYEAYCYGVPDEKKGHVLRLAIVIRRGYESVPVDELKSNIRRKVQETLPESYEPDKIIVLEKLPRTPVGKVDDAAISKLEEQGRI